MSDSLKAVLVKRDGMSETEAQEEIADMRERIYSGDDPAEVLLDYGLEEDYIFDII